jgi:hypothetical protein
MWHALRTELVYFRPWMLGGLGIAFFVVVLLSVLVRFLEEGDGPPSLVAAMMPIIAGMVVSFIAQSYRVVERRARWLLAGSLTPGQLAGVTVLLPPCFVGLGVLAGIPMVYAATVISGQLEQANLWVVAGFAVQFLGYAQLGPLAQESTAARRQQRPRAAFAGWVVFVTAILVLAASQFFVHSIEGQLAQVVTVLAVMGAAAALYSARTDFTR